MLVVFRRGIRLMMEGMINNNIISGRLLLGVVVVMVVVVHYLLLLLLLLLHGLAVCLRGVLLGRLQRPRARKVFHGLRQHSNALQAIA